MSLITINLKCGHNHIRPIGEGVIGALDMGGSSTQLVFHKGSNMTERVKSEDFWLVASPQASPRCINK